MHMHVHVHVHAIHACASLLIELASSSSHSSILACLACILPLAVSSTADQCAALLGTLEWVITSSCTRWSTACIQFRGGGRDRVRGKGKG